MTIWRRFARWISKGTRAQTHTYTQAHARTPPLTHTEICNTYCFSTATVVLWKHLNVTLHVECLSCSLFSAFTSLRLEIQERNFSILVFYCSIHSRVWLIITFISHILNSAVLTDRKDTRQSTIAILPFFHGASKQPRQKQLTRGGTNNLYTASKTGVFVRNSKNTQIRHRYRTKTDVANYSTAEL